MFYVENQCVYQWATLEDGDDPPVFGRYEDTDPWKKEGVRVSEHLILASLFEAIFHLQRYGASVSWLDEATVNEIADRIPAIAIEPWLWPGPTRFYAANGAFMCTAPNGEVEGKNGLSVHIGAKTEHPLQFLKAYVDKDWEYVAL